jgi:hypothetical protein
MTNITVENVALVRNTARVAHEINREFCMAIGDFSQVGWNDAPQWQRDSAVDGVMFHVENPDAGPEATHENWMRAKIIEGWVYGEEKDPVNKVHPCLVPYDELPIEQRAKDYLFASVVKSAIAAGKAPEYKMPVVLSADNDNERGEDDGE